MSKLLLLFAGCVLLGQPRPEFEVASIKPNRSGVAPDRINPVSPTPGGRFTATNVTLVDLIVRFYPTRRIQMQGGPGWIDSDSERFDVVAKAPASERELKYADFRADGTSAAGRSLQTGSTPRAEVRAGAGAPGRQGSA